MIMHILLLYLQPQLTKVGPINGHSKEKEVHHNRIIKGVLHYQIFRHHTSCSAYIYYYSTSTYSTTYLYKSPDHYIT